MVTTAAAPVALGDLSKGIEEGALPKVATVSGMLGLAAIETVEAPLPVAMVGAALALLPAEIERRVKMRGRRMEVRGHLAGWLGARTVPDIDYERRDFCKRDQVRYKIGRAHV